MKKLSAKKLSAPNSLQSFVENKFKSLDSSQFLTWTVIANFIDSLGSDGLSLSAEILYDQYKDSGNMVTISKVDISVFLANSFINKWLDNKVIEIQRPVLRKIIMGLKDSNANASELRAIETFRTLVSTSDESSNGVIYVYVQTNISNGDEEITNNLMEKYVREDK